MKVNKLFQYSNSQNGWVISAKGISHCFAGGGKGHDTDKPKILLNMDNQEKKNYRFRIRKLTPGECFTLMGVRPEQVKTLLNCGVSKSQLYKMAGNSIVVDVLKEIFASMFVNYASTDKVEVMSAKKVEEPKKVEIVAGCEQLDLFNELEEE